MSTLAFLVREAEDILAGRSDRTIQPQHARALLLHAADLQSRLDLFSQEARAIADEKHRARLINTLTPPAAFGAPTDTAHPAGVPAKV